PREVEKWTARAAEMMAPRSARAKLACQMLTGDQPVDVGFLNDVDIPAADKRLLLHLFVVNYPLKAASFQELARKLDTQRDEASLVLKHQKR
ncbi:MAG: hypothetical protein ACRCZF_07145, partial [Gemmataceae bacterium]